MNEGKAASGIPGLDSMISGGLSNGSLSLVIGPSGSGKTIFGLQFLTEGALSNKKSLYLTFNFDPFTSLDKYRDLYFTLERNIEKKKMFLFRLDLYKPFTAKDGAKITKIIKTNGIERVFVDTLVSYSSEKSIASLLSLLEMLKQTGVTVLLAQRGSADINSLEAHYLPIDTETVFFLSHFEDSGELRKYLCVLKHTGRTHDTALKEFSIGEQGIHILGRVQGFGGMLSGNPEKKTDTISFMTGVSNADGPGADDINVELVREFNKGREGFLVNHVFFSGSRIRTVEEFKRLSPGVGLVYVDSDLVPLLFKEGLLADISAFLPQSSLNEFLRLSYQPFMYDGALYGISKNLELNMLFYRKDLLKKHGLKPPSSWEEIVNTAKKVLAKEKNPALSGFVFMTSIHAEHPFTKIMLQYILNNTTYDPEEKIRIKFDTGECAGAMEFFKGLFATGGISPQEGLDTEKIYFGHDAFYGGNAVFMHGSSDAFVPFKWPKTRISIEEHLGFCLFPAGPLGNKSRPVLQSAVYVVPKVSKNKESSLEFLRYILSEAPAKNALRDYPFPPQVALYSNPEILSERPYYSEFFDMLMNAVVPELMTDQEKILPLMYEEFRDVVMKNGDVKKAVNSLEKRLSLKLGRKEEFIPQIRAAIKFIETNYNKKISLGDLAAVAKLSPAHFNRLFKRETGSSAVNYLNETRIEKAKELLANEKTLNISEIAYRMGYPDPLYFCAIFKKKAGLSPTAYRERFL